MRRACAGCGVCAVVGSVGFKAAGTGRDRRFEGLGLAMLYFVEMRACGSQWGVWGRTRCAYSARSGLEEKSGLLKPFFIGSEVNHVGDENVFIISRR